MLPQISRSSYGFTALRQTSLRWRKQSMASASVLLRMSGCALGMGARDVIATLLERRHLRHGLICDCALSRPASGAPNTPGACNQLAFIAGVFQGSGRLRVPAGIGGGGVLLAVPVTGGGCGGTSW